MDGWKGSDDPASFLGYFPQSYFSGEKTCRLKLPPGWLVVAPVAEIGRVALDLGAFLDRSEVGGWCWCLGKGKWVGLVFMVGFYIYTFFYK